MTPVFCRCPWYLYARMRLAVTELTIALTSPRGRLGNGYKIWTLAFPKLSVSHTTIPLSLSSNALVQRPISATMSSESKYPKNMPYGQYVFATSSSTPLTCRALVNLGKSGLRVSKIILGCMTYGSPTWNAWSLVKRKQSNI